MCVRERGHWEEKTIHNYKDHPPTGANPHLLLLPLHILHKVLPQVGLVCKGLELVVGPCVVHEDDVETVPVPEVAQLPSEVDVPRDEHHGGRGREVVSKLPHGIAQLVVSSILGNRTNMDHSYLQGDRVLL